MPFIGFSQCASLEPVKCKKLSHVRQPCRKLVVRRATCNTYPASTGQRGKWCNTAQLGLGHVTDFLWRDFSAKCNRRSDVHAAVLACSTRRSVTLFRAPDDPTVPVLSAFMDHPCKFLGQNLHLRSLGLWPRSTELAPGGSLAPANLQRVHPAQPL